MINVIDIESDRQVSRIISVILNASILDFRAAAQEVDSFNALKLWHQSPSNTCRRRQELGGVRVPCAGEITIAMPVY